MPKTAGGDGIHRPATATAKGTESGGEPGVLRFDFNEPEESLKEISWDVFFDKFEKENLALLYEDTTKDGNESRFFKLVNR